MYISFLFYVSTKNMSLVLVAASLLFPYQTDAEPAKLFNRNSKLKGIQTPTSDAESNITWSDEWFLSSCHLFFVYR